MAFTTEDDVRLRFQLNDEVEAPSSLVAACIDEAHGHILRFLDPQYDVPAPPAALVVGETFLAGAGVLRALASKRAQAPTGVTVGGQRIDDSARFQSLAATAAAAVDQAWSFLEPYLVDRPVRIPIESTETVPVLGEE